MEAGKPVIASMGDVAASGGYMLAAPCSRILAQPGTVTGSIGVIMGKVCCGVFLMCVWGGSAPLQPHSRAAWHCHGQHRRHHGQGMYSVYVMYHVHGQGSPPAAGLGASSTWTASVSYGRLKDTVICPTDHLTQMNIAQAAESIGITSDTIKVRLSSSKTNFCRLHPVVGCLPQKCCLVSSLVSRKHTIKVRRSSAR